MKFKMLVESEMITELSQDGKWVTFKNGQHTYIGKNGDIETGTLKGYNVNDTVSQGTIVRSFNVTEVSMGGTGPVYGYTNRFYIWKANGYTLTNSDKTAINAENGRTIDSIYSSASVGGVPWAITYDSGSV